MKTTITKPPNINMHKMFLPSFMLKTKEILKPVGGRRPVANSVLFGDPRGPFHFPRTQRASNAANTTEALGMGLHKLRPCLTEENSTAAVSPCRGSHEPREFMDNCTFDFHLSLPHRAAIKHKKGTSTLKGCPHSRYDRANPNHPVFIIDSTVSSKELTL